MVRKAGAAAVLGLMLMLGAGGARADVFNLLVGVYGPKGNDTGGIIPWSPEAERWSFEIAQSNCGRWHKYAVRTSIHRRYGDYIAYACRWNPPAYHRYHGRRARIVISK